MYAHDEVRAVSLGADVPFHAAAYTPRENTFDLDKLDMLNDMVYEGAFEYDAA